MITYFFPSGWPPKFGTLHNEWNTVNCVEWLKLRDINIKETDLLCVWTGGWFYQMLDR